MVTVYIDGLSFRLKDSFSSTLVYRLTSFTLHTLTSTNTHTQHRALDSVEWGAALLAVRLLFGTLSPVLFMLGEPVSGWFGFGLPFSATVRSPCLWGFAPSVWCLVVMEMRGSGGSGVPEPRGGLQMVSWVSLHLPLAPGGFFYLVSYLFHRPYPVNFMTHTQHKIADLCICVFAVFSSSCFVFLCWFFVFYFSELHQLVTHHGFPLELCPIDLMFSSISSFFPPCQHFYITHVLIYCEY